MVTSFLKDCCKTQRRMTINSLAWCLSLSTCRKVSASVIVIFIVIILPGPQGCMNAM